MPLLCILDIVGPETSYNIPSIFPFIGPIQNLEGLIDGLNNQLTDIKIFEIRHSSI